MTIKEQIAEARSHELLTVEQVALLTQYSPKYLYRKIAKGQIPGVQRFGAGIRVNRAAILAWQHQRDHHI